MKPLSDKIFRQETHGVTSFGGCESSSRIVQTRPAALHTLYSLTKHNTKVSDPNKMTNDPNKEGKIEESIRLGIPLQTLFST